MSITIELPPHEMFEIAEGVIREKQVEIDALKANVAALVDAARGAVSATELIDRDRATDAGFLLALRIGDALRAALGALR